MIVSRRCSRCGGQWVPTFPYRRVPAYCRPCAAAAMRASRARVGPDEPDEKSLCRSYANAMQRRGALTPRPCAVCGAPRVDKHHPDYSRPLWVVWLCREHHLAVERGEITSPPASGDRRVVALGAQTSPERRARLRLARDFEFRRIARRRRPPSEPHP